MSMGYKYADHRPGIFTETGTKDLIKVRDTVQGFLKTSGAFTLENAIRGITGDSWQSISYVDYLVELGEIREIAQGSVMGQHRVFVSAR